MTLTGNKLTPSEGMHLQRISDDRVAEGVMYIPSSLTIDDFTEITYEEYLKILQQVDIKPVDDIEQRIEKLEKQSESNANELTSLQKAFEAIKEMLAGLESLMKL